MPVQRLPLFGNPNQRRIAQDILFDQLFQDCIFDQIKNDVTQTQTVTVSARHSYGNNVDSYPTTSSGAGTSILCWLGTGGTDIVTAYGNTNSTIFLNNTSLGAITGQAIHMSETDVSGTPNAVFVSGGNRGYFYPSAGALTEITNANFPPKQSSPLTITGNFVHKDGWAFIMCTNAQIWNSDLNSLANWSANSFITAGDKPDTGIGLARYGEFILAFGKTTIEFFKNAGNASGSPLQRVGKTITSAVVNQHCILEYGDTVVWAATSGPQGPGIYKLSGGDAVKISSQTIDDDVISQALSTADIRLHEWIDYGHRFIIFASEARSWAYDDKVNTWINWTLFLTTGGSGVKKTCTGFISGTAGLRSFAITSVATVYQVSSLTTYMLATIKTSRFNGGTKNRKILNRIGLVGDVANAVTYSISWSDDDYGSFSTARTVTNGAPRNRLTRGGIFVDRVFKISWTNANSQNVRLSALELDFDMCAT